MTKDSSAPQVGSGNQLNPDSVLSKVMRVLLSFGPDDRGVTLAELQRRTLLPKGTLHRLVSNLVVAGLLDRTGEGYKLSGLVFELGMRASVERGLADVAMPFMEDLYELTHETVHLGVREGLEVMYVAKIGGHRQAVAPSRVGGRLPLHCTAIGKVLLANAGDDVLRSYLEAGLGRRAPRTITSSGVLVRQLETVRELGVAFEYEESAVGIVCVAAPITDEGGDVLAAVSATGPVIRFDPQRHARHVIAAAAGIQTTLARREVMRAPRE